VATTRSRAAAARLRALGGENAAGVGDLSSKPHGRRRPRRKGRATKDAERRALAKANARLDRPVRPPTPGFAVLHADGGSRGAPGPAAIGYLIDDEAGVRLAEHAEAIGTTSAAEAEYRALLAGLTHACELGLARVAARSDSRVLIGHVNGERHIRNPRLLALEADIADRRMRIGTVIFEWIPATANGEAHRLVARVLESAPG
jgi:ribonuclease HI